MNNRIFFGLDLENLLGPARRTGDLCDSIEALSQEVAEMQRQGTPLGGIAIADRHLQARTAWALDELGIRVHEPALRGADASDLELIQQLTHYLPDSVTTVVIGSGDHIFAPVATELARRDIDVAVLALPGSISYELYRAAQRYVPLKLPARVPAAA